jgi:hypothetical protein
VAHSTSNDIANFNNIILIVSGNRAELEYCLHLQLRKTHLFLHRIQLVFTLLQTYFNQCSRAAGGIRKHIDAMNIGSVGNNANCALIIPQLRVHSETIERSEVRKDKETQTASHTLWRRWYERAKAVLSASNISTDQNNVGCIDRLLVNSRLQWCRPRGSRGYRWACYTRKGSLRLCSHNQ